MIYREIEKLSTRELQTFWRHYLARLGKSISVEYTGDNPFNFTISEGFGDSKSGYNWRERCDFWYRNSDVVAYNTKDKLFCPGYTGSSRVCIPLFPSFAKVAMAKTIKEHRNDTLQDTKANPADKWENLNAACAASTLCQPMEETEMSSFKLTTNRVLDKNKESVRIATKLATGKTANSFFLNKLLGKFPWYAKAFSKKNKVAENPIAKLVAAETALTLVTHFAPENKKLNYIAEGMIDEALVDVTVNSEMLEKIIGELESMISLPSDIFDK